MYRSSSSSSSSCSSSSRRNMDDKFQLLAPIMSFFERTTKTQRRARSSRIFCDLDAHLQAASPSLQIDTDLAEALTDFLVSSSSTLTLSAFSNTLRKLIFTHSSIFEVITSNDIHMLSHDDDRNQILDDNARLLDTCQTLLASIDDRYAYVQSLHCALQHMNMNMSSKSKVAQNTVKLRVQNALTNAIRNKQQMAGHATHNLSVSSKSMLRNISKKLDALKLNNRLVQDSANLVYGGEVASMLILELLTASLAQSSCIASYKGRVSTHETLWAGPLCALLEQFGNIRSSRPMSRNKKAKPGSLLAELDIIDLSIVHFLDMVHKPTGFYSWEELQRFASATSVCQRDLLDSLDLLRCRIKTLSTFLVNIRMKLL